MRLALVSIAISVLALVASEALGRIVQAEPVVSLARRDHAMRLGDVPARRTGSNSVPV